MAKVYCILNNDYDLLTAHLFFSFEIKNSNMSIIIFLCNVPFFFTGTPFSK